MPAQRAAKAAATLALQQAYARPVRGLASKAGSTRKAKPASAVTTATTAKPKTSTDAATDETPVAPKRKAKTAKVVKKEVILKNEPETDGDVDASSSSPAAVKGKGKGGVKTDSKVKGKGKDKDTAAVVSYSYSSGDVTDEPPPPPKKRQKLVNPKLSNAPVAVAVDAPTANGNVTIQSTVIPDPSSAQTLSSTDLLAKAQAHLIKVNPKLKPIIERHPDCNVFSPAGLAEVVDPFRSLVSGIISQQVSGAAARSIKAKFVALFNPSDGEEEGSFPTPSQCLEKKIDELRTAGLSQRKAEYILGLSEHFVNGQLTTEALLSEPDETVVEKLVAVRGIGKWSAEMFLCFGLKRCDVFSTGDLGIQRGAAILAGRDVAKLKNAKGQWKYMAEKDMLSLSEPFKPYRSVLMWYLWRLCDTDVEAMSK